MELPFLIFFLLINLYEPIHQICNPILTFDNFLLIIFIKLLDWVFQILMFHIELFV